MVHRFNRHYWNKSLESAQQKVEVFYYETRKQLFEYDQALNTQRNNVYGERRRIFEKSSVRGWITEYADRCLTDILMSVRPIVPKFID